jgi:hypothetical protein
MCEALGSNLGTPFLQKKKEKKKVITSNKTLSWASVSSSRKLMPTLQHIKPCGGAKN